LTKESKFLSLVLRHQPELVGLSLGSGGWVLVDDLLSGMASVGHAITREMLHKIVAENDKRRFTLSDDGQRIRAAQGHSVAVDLELVAAIPPDDLFHGTAHANLDAILKEGISPQKRQHVHLSADRETATRVGQRHGKPVVLRIAAGRMHADGHNFWRADNGVWLTAYVAPEYISL
jgi:putative RNA 2'-phosphotransferase